MHFSDRNIYPGDRNLAGVAMVLMLVFGWIPGRQASAQQLMLGPSMSLEDAAGQFANPAIISFQRARLATGAKAYHLGLGNAGGAPLRQGYVLLSSPFFFSNRFGVGAQAQYFDSPIYSRITVGASLSARILGYLSAGVRLETQSLSYNQAEFVGFDPADPVFADGYGKTVPNASIGFFAQPMPNLRLSAGVRNLFRPDLSLAGEGIRQEMEPFIGVGYGIGPAHALIEIYDTFNGIETRFGIEAVSTAGSFFRVSSTSQFEAPRVEGQLYIGGPLSVQYGYELPLGELGPASNGSHTFSVIFDFGRSPELPNPVVLPTFFYESGISNITPQLAPKVYISASTDYVRFYEQQIERTVDSDVPRAALQQLTAEDLGVLDGRFTEGSPQTDPDQPLSTNEGVVMQGSYSPLYDASIRALAQSVASDEAMQVKVVGTESKAMKAAGIRNRLVQNEAVPAERVSVVRTDQVASGTRPATAIVPNESRIIYEPYQAVLYVNRAYVQEEVQRWELIIVDAHDEPVKVFAGNNTLPDQLAWNWTDEKGDLIEPGIYRYRLQWVEENGRLHESNERKLYVQKLLRKTTIQVTRDVEALRREADAVEIRIQH